MSLSEHIIPLSTTGVEVDKEGAVYIPTLSIPAEQPGVATALFGPHPLTYEMCMGESGDALVRNVTFLVVHVRLAGGGEQDVTR